MDISHGSSLSPVGNTNLEVTQQSSSASRLSETNTKVSSIGQVKIQSIQEKLNENEEIRAKIGNIEKLIVESKEKLVGQKVSPFNIIKRIYLYFKQRRERPLIERTIAESTKILENLGAKFNQLNQEIAEAKKLGERIQHLSDFEDLEVLLTDFAHADTYNAAELEFIFEIAGFEPERIEQRQAELEKSQKEPDKLKNWEKLYIQHKNSPIKESLITPLLAKAKHFIQNRPAHFSAKAAASAGQAATSGLGILGEIRKNKNILRKFGDSGQEVIIHNQQVVYKRSKAKAAEEESNVNSLFNLVSKQGVVGAFKIEKTKDLERFGIEQDKEEMKRGIPVSQLHASGNRLIFNKLSREDKDIIEALSKQEKALKKLENDILVCRFKGESKWRKYTYKELNALYIKGRIDETFEYKTSAGVRSLLEELNNNRNTSTNQLDISQLAALTYNPESFLVTPQFNSPASKKNYEKCEKYTWTYTETNKEPKSLSFKDLHQLVAEGNLTDIKIKSESSDSNATNQMESKEFSLEAEVVRPVNNSSQRKQFVGRVEATVKKSNESESLPDINNFKEALDVKWKVIVPHALVNKGGYLVELRNVEAKPFVQNMEIMDNLMTSKKYPNRLHNIMHHMDEEAEFNAILTGEMQLLDLHAGNLGVRPVPNEEYEKFKNHIFDADNQLALSFEELHASYLNGDIADSSIITYQEDGKGFVTKTLGEFPELQRALEVKWTTVIFDTDLSLAEDNELQVQIRKNVIEHLIPLRSVFLELAWKDEPLSEGTVNRLMDTTEKRDESIKNWISKSDAPILRKLSAKNREKIQTSLQPILDRYTLSKVRREKDTNITIKDLQEAFAKQISESPLSQEYKEVWQTIQGDVKTVKVPVKYRETVQKIRNEEGEMVEVVIKSKYTWEELAVLYKQDVETLKKMNSTQVSYKESGEFEDVSASEADFPSGESLEIPHDLLSNNDQAEKNRMKIAAQLFPRLTNAQQKALIERQENRSTYLKDIKALENFTGTASELEQFLYDFIFKPTTPLSSYDRLDMENLIISFNGNRSLLLGAQQMLVERTRPTYFNLMKSMYPLLADAYQLADLMTTKPGRKIGLFISPLELIIEEVKKNMYYISDQEKRQKAGVLIGSLEQAIVNKGDNASFFGNWP